MDISFQNQSLANRFNSDKELQKIYGKRQARSILTRMGVLSNAETLAEIPHRPPERLHQLTGGRQGQFAVDLVQPYRLVFEPDHDPVPKKDDGGIDLTQVTAITVLEVIDYHPSR